jgi:hypothetical protein
MFDICLSHVSLARPSATTLNYLLDLVTQIQQSGGRGDPRSDQDLASALGASPIVLLSLKNTSPQQTALNVFNYLYPGYTAKLKLGSIDKLELLKPGLIDTILGKYHLFLYLGLHVHFI